MGLVMSQATKYRVYGADDVTGNKISIVFMGLVMVTGNKITIVSMELVTSHVTRLVSCQWSW